MMKKIIAIIFIFISLAISAEAQIISERLSGRILLQVEQNGEAWYIDPVDVKRYFLGRPDDAFNLMRNKGIGITNLDLEKIQIGLIENTGPDFDKDGLGDLLEDAIGTNKMKFDTDGDGFGDKDEILGLYNPLNNQKVSFDINFSNSKAGKIFLQVENNGEAWYINPVDGKRYFLGRPLDAFNVMRFLGLGISDDDLNTIPAAQNYYSVEATEAIIHKLVNKERTSRGLKALIWNNDIAGVAREHSDDLAVENKSFALSMGARCDFPLIHHEGFEFGLYQSERLNNRNIYYFGTSAENIALVSSARFSVMYYLGDETKEELDKCIALKERYDSEFREKIYSDVGSDAKVKYVIDEIKNRTESYNNSFIFKNVEVDWVQMEEAAQNTVDGWMNSPGHRANILNADFDEAGIGVSYTDGGYLISTQVFIKKAECGYFSGACCEKEGYYPYCYVGLDCNNMKCVE